MHVILFDMMDTLVRDPYISIVEWLLPEPEIREEYFRHRDRANFEAFEKGEILEYEYFRRFYRSDRETVHLRRLPRPEKIKKEILKNARLFPGMRELLVRYGARSDVSLGIASNYSGWYSEILRKNDDMDSLFDFLFFSCEISCRKPSDHYYDIVHRAIQEVHPGLEADRIAFVDDREENLRPARERGWSVHKMEGVEGLDRWLSHLLD